VKVGDGRGRGDFMGRVSVGVNKLLMEGGNGGRHNTRGIKIVTPSTPTHVRLLTPRPVSLLRLEIKRRGGGDGEKEYQPLQLTVFFHISRARKL
jgi:hypothetical protein